MTDSSPIAQALAQSPAVLRLGISVRDDRLRSRAVDQLARWIANRMDEQPKDERQLTLSL